MKKILFSLLLALLPALPGFGQYTQGLTNKFASGANAIETDATTLTAATFRSNVAVAWTNGAGGVFDLPLSSGYGTVYRGNYGNGKRVEMTSTVTMQNLTYSATSFTPISDPNATTSGNNQSDYTLTFGLFDTNSGLALVNEGVKTIGFVILSRGNTTYPLDIRATVTYSDASTEVVTSTISNVSGGDDTFYGFSATGTNFIVSVRLQSFDDGTSTPISNRIGWDDFGFITRPIIEFTTQPVNTIAELGGTVSLSAAAVADAQSVSYQWQKVSGGTTNNLTDGTGTAGGAAVVTGATGPTLTFAGASAGDMGVYQVVVTASPSGFSWTSQQALLANIVYTSAQPDSVATKYSSNVTFTASMATTNATLSYQWYKGSTPLVDGPQPGGSTISGASGTTPGATLTSTLSLTAVSYLDAGAYTLYATNTVNNNVLATIPATLSVLDPWIKTQPPVYTFIPQGGSDNFRVVALGSGVTYQWYNNSGPVTDGGDFSGATSNRLYITNAHAADAGTYYVVVGGSSGATVQSSNSAVIIGGSTSVMGPFSQDNWPTCMAGISAGMVDYAVFDPGVSWTAPSDWQPVMTLRQGGDQPWVTVTIGGGSGSQATGTYMNFQDPNWAHWVNVPVIDVLLCVYGNSSMYKADGSGRGDSWTRGTTTTGPYNSQVGTFPMGANNGQWNWMLLSVPNPIDPNGLRYVGDPAGAGTYGGVNSGTMRIYASDGGSLAGFTVRAVAFGPQGVFGTSNQINRFAASANCAPEPAVNLAYIDFNAGVTNNLSVLNDAGLGETWTLASGVGPVGDLRTAIQCTSGLMEFAVLNNYLGLPCNQNLSMQVCLDVYDDPALANLSTFGPYQYATDYQGDLATYTGSPYTLTGSGKWLKVAFFVGPANLQGVHTAPLTGGPTMFFGGLAPYISRVQLGVVRTGTNALAGQTPDPTYHIDPFICATNYGYYAEWYPSGGILNNVDNISDLGTGGPVGDLRTCVVPEPVAGGYYYLRWSLQNQVFGPTVQDNADVIMTLTYYDDPALAGKVLFANTYSTMENGNITIANFTTTADYNGAVTLKGSGQWKEAQFEIPDVNFQNGGGQWVCRYAANAQIQVCRVRYNVFRPCGPFQGIDYLQTMGMTNANPDLKVNWRGTGNLRAAPVVTGPYTSLVNLTNTAKNVITLPMTNDAQFLRLQFPSYPSYLSTNGP